MLKPLYIIPARGGSKGIPRKNIKALGGRPLIAYTIDAAKEAQSRTGGYILLSTDDAEIASVARECGLDTDYMRPAELGSDTTGSREIILDAMDWASANGIDYDCVVLLQPTSPFRTAADIICCLDKFTDGTDMAVTVCETDSNPYYTLFETDSEGYLHISKGDGLYTRRQDVPPVYEYNGAVYVINPDSLRRMPLGAFPHRVPYVMPKERSIDLDTPEQWLLAEYLIKK